MACFPPERGLGKLPQLLILRLLLPFTSHPSDLPRFLREGFWVLALLAITASVWLTHYERWTVSSWNRPTDYRGDSLEILARIEAASEGDLAPFRVE